MIDPTGALIVEIRDYLDDNSITDRVRGFEPAGSDIEDGGDQRGPGSYVRFVVVVGLDVPPDIDLPITDARYAVRCYGTTPHDAFLVYAGVVAAIHRIGPRVKTNGLAIYQSFMESGGTPEKDPDTQQPLVVGIIHLIATTQEVA